MGTEADDNMRDHVIRIDAAEITLQTIHHLTAEGAAGMDGIGTEGHQRILPTVVPGEEVIQDRDLRLVLHTQDDCMGCASLYHSILAQVSTPLCLRQNTVCDMIIVEECCWNLFPTLN